MKPKLILEEYSRRVSLLPGLSVEDVAGLQKTLGAPLPDEIVELLTYSAGFDLASMRGIGDLIQIRFNGASAFDFSQALPCSIALLNDGSGNFWTVDINLKNGEWGPIFFVSHDPPALAVQAPDLATFLSQLLARDDSAKDDVVQFVPHK